MIARYLLVPLAFALAAQNISVSDPATSWITTVPEPPIPRVAAGQSFNSWFGHRVTRITDMRTADANSAWNHYYVDRSPLNKDSSFLAMQGAEGPIWIQAMEGPVPKGRPYPLVGTGKGPGYVASNMWSPTETDTLWVVGDNMQLWTIDVRLRKWKMVRDFTKDFAQGVPKGGYLKIQALSPDSKRMVLDYSLMAKECYGVVAYEPMTNNARIYKGRMQNRNPQPNSSFTMAGAGSADREVEYVTIQENGTPINPASPDPLDWANTLSFVVPWKDNLLGTGYALAGRFPTFHGAALSHGQARVGYSEVGMYIQPLDWLTALRKITLDKGPNPADKGRIPFEDVFYWPGSYGMTGVHVAATGPTDEWMALSLYQETSCGVRFVRPLANEIILVSSRVKAVYDPQTHTIKSNGVFRRLTHHYSYPEDCAKPSTYWGAPRAVISMDGKYVVFTSTMGRTGHNDIFILTLPKMS